MNLTHYERNVILVSLDHMEEHLFILYESGDIIETIYNLRIKACNTARNKITMKPIKQQYEISK
mgnify:FL=1|jgi:hypothetical protein|tara:strand:+ start:209 stop:400 length:192 start_codon:yes stop_codon:yes gene_type:complete